jgi:glutamate N-acetyltransferase/amino-acid N-acetyltransferase
MAFAVPQGFRVAGVHCGIKSNPEKHDLSLFVADEPAVTAGVYTTNLIFAAPVAWDRARTPSEQIRLVVANSGNANACTGERGMTDAGEMARLAAEACGTTADQALVLSTGVIGEFLPMTKVGQGIQAAAEQLATDEAALVSAARGVMTTDRFEKVVSRQVDVDGQVGTITGVAKGAGMIGPKMATMLCVILTDVTLSVESAQRLLGDVVDRSFNCISVEGHMSTNDTVLLLASGKVGRKPLEGPSLTAFRDGLEQVSVDVARMIPDDGEGASHLITIHVRGCEGNEQAHQIARTVANSSLVKTAVAGCDPNWGRIVSAAGYAGVPFEPRNVSLSVNGFTLYQDGAPVRFEEAAVSQSMRDNRETDVVLGFGEGSGEARFWTSDLTVDYVKLNAEYHT